MQKTERLLAITLLLQARGKMTARRLAQILGTSTRTIYRDINTLSLAHVPVTMDYGPGGGYYLPDDYHFESAIFTREEAVSLILSADMSGNYSLFAGDDRLHRALIKLEATLPEEYRIDVRAARERILFDTTAWCRQAPPTTYLETIRSAVLDSYHLDMLYPCVSCKDASGVRWRHVEPYGLVFKGLSRRHVRTGVWYLVAFCHSCQAFQTFRVSHIQNLCVRKEHIRMLPNFDLQSYWEEERRFLDIEKQSCTLILRVTPQARYNLRGDYIILQEERDSYALVQVELESIDAAASYTLSLGAGATVISPDEAREAVALTAHAIAEKYDDMYSDTGGETAPA
jgi:predicted DNA-binding transcriptional regulator YafY